MTTAEAKRVILLSVVAMVALATVRELRKGDLPRPRVVIGGFATGIMLNLLAGPAPKVAGGLALVAVTANVLSERATIESLTRLLERK